MSENGEAEEADKTDETVLHSKIQLEAPEGDHHVTAKSRKIVLTKFTIYVTNHRMYIVGSNVRETVFRIMEIDMDNSIEELVVMEDNVYFKRNEIMDVLNGLEESSDGGLTKKITAVALLGFTKLTKCFYLVVVTKRKTVAVLGSHSIYHIEETEMIPVTHNYKTPDRNSDEARYMQTFMNIDLNKTFYYSDSYDITNTLQTNMIRNKTQSLGLNADVDLTKVFKYNERFVWNNALLEPLLQSFDRVYDWFQPIIHGFIDQVEISIFETQVYVTLIARRSHHFAGARFFKRGVNEMGNVANEVETEQIVADMLTSSFHDTIAGFYNNPRYSSFVQHRGSIPLSWSQTTAANLRIKPPIEFDMMDPYYTQSALHFDDMFQRYGSPIQILNLIKQREKTPRETKLLDEFTECITYLNQFLPLDGKLDYTNWDMSRASKSRGQDVIEWLEGYSESSVNKTGIFLNGRTLKETQLQQGICRTNCVDCLDRTNTAQFVIGKRALGHQLFALGVINDKYLEYDSDVTNILTEMFHDHGDTIALQYGGSHLVNTLQTYRKINQWSSHSRDIIESVKRFYSNSMVDAQKQEAMNLFLGNHRFEEGKPKIWELNSDYYLHNTGSRVEVNYSPSYTQWFTNSGLVNKKDELMTKWNEKRRGDPVVIDLEDKGLLIEKVDPYPGFFENYWNLKYPIKELTQMDELFEFTMNSTSNYSISKVKLLNNSVPSAGVEGMIQPPRTRNRDRFALFRFFNDKTADDTRSTNTDMISISNSIFGGTNSIFEEASSGVGGGGSLDFDGKEWFSPFKSRKPHRELKLNVGNLTPEGAVFKNREVQLLEGIRERLHIGDELYVSTGKGKWMDDVIAFSVLQAENQKEIDERYSDMIDVCKVAISQNHGGEQLPVVDAEGIQLSQQLREFDIAEKSSELNKLFKSLDEEYRTKPEVGTADMKMYGGVINMEPVVDVPRQEEHHLNNTVIFKDEENASGLPEIRKQWKLRGRRDAADEDEAVSEGDSDDLRQVYSELMTAEIPEYDIEMYRSMARGEFTVEQSRYSRRGEVNMAINKAVDTGIKRPRAQTTGGIDYREAVEAGGRVSHASHATASRASRAAHVAHSYSFYGLKKKLSQYNIRGI